MRDPLTATFDLLGNTRNPHAVNVLVPALDVADVELKTKAAASLLRRKSSRGQIELVRRLNEFGPEMRDTIAKNAGSIDSSLRQCLLHGDPTLQKNALDMIRWLEDFQQLPGLLNLLEDKNCPHRELAFTVTQELIEAAYVYLNTDPVPETEQSTAAAHRHREAMIAALENSCNRFETHALDLPVEGLLMLAPPEHSSIKKVVRGISHPARVASERQLLESTHPGIIHQVIGFMEGNYPPQVAFQAVRQRLDPEFIVELLRSWPRKLSSTQEHNYKQLQSIAWLSGEFLRLEVVPPSLQVTLVNFIQETSLPDAEKRRAWEWIVRRGAPAARKAASEALGSEDDAVMQGVVIEGLYSENADVQAWATTQLRTRGVPQAFTLLIQRLDSPLAEVQEAARNELGDFNLPRLLDLFDQLDPGTCILAGQLIQKIDPHAIERLKQQMLHPMRSKRIRSAQLARAIHVQHQVVDALLSQLGDSDAMVRRTAVDVLATVNSPAAVQGLQKMLEDQSPRVREEAERALKTMREQWSLMAEPVITE